LITESSLRDVNFARKPHLDYLDWQAAEREGREARAIGFFET
jgi:hypothetical protein